VRIAYLILAHTDPLQLHRLVSALDGEHAEFFIHIDGKVDMGPFAATLAHRTNVKFIQRRLRVTWGGFSQVEAVLALMREALVFESACDYLILLSGLDYPIKSNRFILRYLGESNGREFINYISIREHPFLEWKINMIWPNEILAINRLLHRCRRLKLLGTLQTFFLGRRGFPSGFEPYVGATWWALTRDCVEYVVRFVEGNQRFVQFYRLTHAPDEAFFHTILLNSGYAERTNRKVEYVSWPGTPHRVAVRGDLITYFRVTKGHADVLDEGDFGILEKSSCLFARKFRSGRSLRLIEQIDRKLLDRRV
jgi:hypothetical protein